MKKKQVEEPIPAKNHDQLMQIITFLDESNHIENVHGHAALDDAIGAWHFAYYERDRPMTVAYILEIHRLLLQRLEPRIAGKLRDCDVWIGNERKRFIAEQVLVENLEEWIKFCDIEKALKKKEELREEIVKKWHVMFEDIHPHADGNGRTGRILWQIQRILLCLPVMVIDSRTKYEDYYPWFQKSDSQKPNKIDPKHVERMMKGLMEEGL